MERAAAMIQEELHMRFDMGPLSGVTRLPQRPAAPEKAEPATGDFAKVYDITKARRGAPDVPRAVWDEVDRAAQVAADLDAQGRMVRFHAPEGNGRMRAELVDADGRVLRPLSLGEIISIGSMEPPSAA
jgi:hypothetical protein